MGTLNTLRKAYGVLKDKTKIGLAKFNSNFKELDITIIKATNHIESPPKERHVGKIFAATSVSRPQTDIAYCVQALAKRLSKTRSWIVATKILIVIHRTLREGDPTFRDELLNYAHRGNFLQISNFKDDSSHFVWVKTYVIFLEERLDCFRVLQYDIEAERLTKLASGGSSKGQSRRKSTEELIEQLPALQQLLSRLIGCQPEGAASDIYLIQYALALVLKESFKIYCAINDGIMNLIDVFFRMSQDDAIKALEIYKRAGQQVEELAEFYEYCKGLELAKNFQFPTLRQQPPPSFLATMEEYVKEAPQSGSVQNKLENEGREQVPEVASDETKKQGEIRINKLLINEQEKNKLEEPRQLIPMEDLLGPYETNPTTLEIEKNNGMALAIVPSGTNLASHNLSEQWDLALFTAPSNNTTHAVESELANGFNKLLVYSVYEDEAIRRQKQLTNARYGYEGVAIVQNPFQDTFIMPNHIAAPTNVPMMPILTQQQQYPQQQQPMMMIVPYRYPQQLQVQHMGHFSPFGEPPLFSIPPNSILLQ
ncbi:hypothetical protein ES332_A08G096300v1 [Gossypium tomentosum]|uniref:ENTH domain-containing protein n=1 Tax=Gossypium tomentosum TaxID=34277 RepID=A0A5D2PFE4_GOSTO|nr:hypothetical protein ES332_A08G096300v1 [Gossypium tomentosum]